jgi:hypothetical protein
MLDAPFINIIGLYSNMAENPGFISGAVPGQKQKNWLVKTLTAIQAERKKGNRKALVIAVHHPPISGGGGHASSTDMLNDIDDACNKSGIMPDAILAAHAHNLQRFTRFMNFGGKDIEIPFIIAGTVGRGLSGVPKATGARTGDHTFEKSLSDYGYLIVTVTEKLLTLQFNRVDNTGKKTVFDKVIVDLKTNKLK